jgi:pimeloyl-ACP methyl ester carboxylesterase
VSGALTLNSLHSLETVQARGRKVTYLAHGYGPKDVLLMHGNPSNPWVYSGLLTTLPEDEFRVVVVDWYGDSERPWGGYNVSGYADQLRDVMDALEIPSAIVVGHSLGGVTSQLFALRYPERLEKLILIGTGPTTRQHGRLTIMLDQLRWTPSPRQALETIFAGSYGSPLPPDVLNRYVEHGLKVPIQAYIDAMESAFWFDFVPLLPYIQARTLILHGRFDTGRPIEHAVAFEQGLPHNELVMLECGHYLMEELPDQFNAAVRQFLRA